MSVIRLHPVSMIYFDDISIASICSGEVYVPVICRSDLTALRQRNVYPMMHFAPARTKAGRNDPAGDRTLQFPVYGVSSYERSGSS